MPDNTIGWGQGSVNNDISWGKGPINNALSWGMIGEDSYGHDETNLMGGSEGSLYISTTTAAGYSGGSAACADETFNALKAIPALGYTEALAYIAATDADSYSGGGVFCSEQSFEALINIA
jgi:hypothetical protein